MEKFVVSIVSVDKCSDVRLNINQDRFLLLMLQSINFSFVFGKQLVFFAKPSLDSVCELFWRKLVNEDHKSIADANDYLWLGFVWLHSSYFVGSCVDSSTALPWKSANNESLKPTKKLLQRDLKTTPRFWICGVRFWRSRCTRNFEWSPGRTSTQVNECTLNQWFDGGSRGGSGNWTLSPMTFYHDGGDWDFWPVRKRPFSASLS